jgi:two-component system, NarL family, nitrate/nitrite response regulator NarL
MPDQLAGGISVEKCADGHESAVQVVVVGQDLMSGQLLANALSRHDKYRAISIPPSELAAKARSHDCDVAVIAADLKTNAPQRNGFDLARAVRRISSAIPIVILLEQSTRPYVITAFRCGARGVISRQQPIGDFLECVEHVHKGLIWAGVQESAFLLEALQSIPAPVVSVKAGSAPLTRREVQVVQYAAQGKTNKAIANNLNLSEHTVKNYLFRAFEKVGVSSRIELLFYLTTNDNAF